MTFNCPADLALLIDRAAVAHDRFMNGDAAGSFAMNPRTTDFSIMTPFGGFTAGGVENSPMAIQAMSRLFSRSVTGFDLIAHHAGEDMIVLMAIERAHGVIGGLPEQDWSLRVTLVFRRGPEGWRLAHRHADPLVAPLSLEQLATIARGEVKPPVAP